MTSSGPVRNALHPFAMPRAVALLRGALVGAVVLAALGLLTDPGGAAGWAVEYLLMPFIPAAAALMCAARAALIVRERAAWATIAIGVTLFAAAYIYWSVSLRHQSAPPYPSVADAGWLAFYPLSYLGLGLLVRSRVVRFQGSVWLDGLIGGLAIASIGAAVILPVVLDSSGGSLAVVATNLAYPLADLLMLGVISAVLFFTGLRPGKVWLMIGAGFGSIAVADVIYLFALADGTYQPGTILDLLWPAGLAIIALSSWEHHRRSSAVLVESWRTLAVPSTLSLAALCILVYGHFGEVNDFAVGLAALTVISVVLRTSLTFHELRQLTDTRRLALTDELTGLGNRRHFHASLRAMVADARRQQTSLAVLMLDLDSFKDLNDTLGHQSGDVVLEQLGGRLTQVVPRDAVVARVGGDEFAVVLGVGSSLADAEQLAGIVLRTMAERYHAHDLLLRMTGSIGIAMYPAHALDADELLQRVDLALYEAKDRPGTYSVFAPGSDASNRDRLYLAQELRDAIERDELEVFYQPQVELLSGEVPSVEALVRWRHPLRGLISPATFLPLAERTDLSRAITRSVVDQVTRQLQRWRATGTSLRVSVNLAAADLLDSGFCDELTATLTSRGLAPADVVLEITEGIVMLDGKLSHHTIGQLDHAGFALALDDFGTGHSSLSRLHDLPLSELKIDRSFVARLHVDPGAQSIIRSIIDLAENLNLRLVAEGPEDAATALLLRDLGCQFGQGFVFSRPVPADELESWLAERHSTALAL